MPHIFIWLMWKDMGAPRLFDDGFGNYGFFIHDRGDFIIDEAGRVGAGFRVDFALSVVCLGEYA